jgi:hypothetical protein
MEKKEIRKYLKLSSNMETKCQPERLKLKWEKVERVDHLIVFSSKFIEKGGYIEKIGEWLG